MCSLEPRALEKSDARRLELRQLQESLQMAAFSADVAAASKLLLPEMLRLLDTELLGNCALKSKVLTLGFLPPGAASHVVA